MRRPLLLTLAALATALGLLGTGLLATLTDAAHGTNRVATYALVTLDN